MKSVASRTLSLLVGLAAVCASAPVCAREEICRQIADFALETPQDTSRSIELQNDWGNLSKYCSANDYVPGEKLCDWLLANTSSEFMHINVVDALTCLYPDDPTVRLPRESPELLIGKYSSFGARHLTHEYEVILEFSIGVEGKLDTLKLTVAKEDLE